MSNIYSILDGYDLQWSLSRFYNAQTGINSLFCKGIISDQTIVETLAEHYPEERLAQLLCCFQTNEFVMAGIVKHGATSISGNRFTRNDTDNIRKHVKLLAEFIRCVVNDMIYAALIEDEPLIYSNPADPVKARYLEQYSDLSLILVRVSRSLRSTHEYLVAQKLMSVDTDGRAVFTPETKPLFQGIARMSLVSLLSSMYGDRKLETELATSARATNPLSPRTLVGSANVVLDAMVGIFGNMLPDQDSDGAVLVHASHVLAIVVGDPSLEPKFRDLLRKVLTLACARIATANGIKDMVDGNFGATTPRQKATEDLRAIPRRTLANLASKSGRIKTLKAKADGTLMRTVKTNRNESGNGEIYALIDCTGSTFSGGRIIDGNVNLALIFETIALSIAHSARASGVDASIAFYGERILHIVKISPNDDENQFRQSLYSLVGHAGSYENNESVAFRHIIDLMKVNHSINPKPQSIFFLTDGRILTQTGYGMTGDSLYLELSTMTSKPRILPMVVHPNIDSDFAKAFKDSQFIHVKDKASLGVEHIEDIMRFVADLSPEELERNPYKAIQDWD